MRGSTGGIHTSSLSLLCVCDEAAIQRLKTSIADNRSPSWQGGRRGKHEIVRVYVLLVCEASDVLQVWCVNNINTRNQPLIQDADSINLHWLLRQR